MRWTFILTVAACSGAPAKPTPPPPAPVVPIVAAPPDAAPDAGPDPILGAQLYEIKACKACHSIDGKLGVGATMQGFFGMTVELTDGSSVVADEAYVRESILKPTVKMRAGFPPTMPSYEGVLAPAELDALVAYIRSLR